MTTTHVPTLLSRLTLLEAALVGGCALAFTAMPSTIVAQTALTTPPGLATVEGNSNTTFGVFSTPGGRYQWIDGELTGAKRGLTGISVRINYQNHWSGTAAGRSFTRLVLTLGESDTTSATTTFSLNYKTVGQQVFSSNHYSLRGYVGTPFFLPVPWSDISFPFSSAFVYSGRRDLLVDFSIRGGALSNGSTLQTAWPALYYLDAHLREDFMEIEGGVQHPARPTACVDSGAASALFAATTARGWIYAKNYRDPTYAETLRYQPSAILMAALAPVVMAVTDQGSATGVDVGARCQRLHASFAGYYVMLSRHTDNRGSLPPESLDFVVPFRNTYSGQSIWAQTAWVDSALKRVSLTTAFELKIPVVDASFSRYWRTFIGSVDPSALGGHQVVRYGDGAAAYNPAFHYNQK